MKNDLAFPQGATVVCMIRHGETDWNATGRLQGREDIELNDAGREQAAQLAGFFNKGQWDVIISSPLRRAYETARMIADKIGLTDIHLMETLKERDYGAASGLLPEDRRRRFPDGVIPGQEEFESLRIRAIEALTGIVKEHPGKKILVVSHGALSNAILYTLSGGEFGSFTTRLKNGCINLLVHQDSQWSVTFFNKTVEELTDLAYDNVFT